MGTGIARTRHGWLSWEWITGPLVIVSLVACSRVGHWLPMVVQDAAFLIVVATPFLLTTMAWAGFVKVRRDRKVPRWRFWISLCGCFALSLALAMPWIAFLLSMLRLHLFDWLRLIVWCLAASLGALIAGIFGPKSLRFPLIFGGLVTGGLVVIIPIGVL